MFLENYLLAAFQSPTPGIGYCTMRAISTTFLRFWRCRGRPISVKHMCFWKMKRIVHLDSLPTAHDYVKIGRKHRITAVLLQLA